MSELTFEKFDRPPIKEAVFILNFNRPISLEKIKELSEVINLIKKYPVIQPSIQNNVRINASIDSSSTSINKLQDGLIFRTSLKNPEWILQVKKHTILLHKIGNYSTWKNLVAEFNTVAILLTEKFNKDVEIKEIGIRYINHIPVNQTESLRDLFKLLPEDIEGVPINLNKLFLQLGIQKEDMNGLIIESMLEVNSILNFVIDIRVTKALSNGNFDFKILEPHLNHMRNLKNQIFFNIITEKLKTKFR